MTLKLFSFYILSFMLIHSYESTYIYKDMGIAKLLYDTENCFKGKNGDGDTIFFKFKCEGEGDSSNIYKAEINDCSDELEEGDYELMTDIEDFVCTEAFTASLLSVYGTDDSTCGYREPASAFELDACLNIDPFAKFELIEGKVKFAKYSDNECLTIEEGPHSYELGKCEEDNLFNVPGNYITFETIKESDDGSDSGDGGSDTDDGESDSGDGGSDSSSFKIIGSGFFMFIALFPLIF